MNRRRKHTLAQIAMAVADARLHITKLALAQEADWLARHPYRRSCYLCKKVHTYPRPLEVRTGGAAVMRWAGRKCLAKKFGPPSSGGFTHYVLHR